MKRDLQLDLEATTTVRWEKTSRQWRHALALIAFAMVWILACYAPTAVSMAEIWKRNDTFVHGFIVPLVSLWLVWRKRQELALLVPQPSWSALAALPLIGIAWLLGELASANVVSQLALTALLILSVITIIGRAAARTLAFPLSFLFFAVPMGEFILPYLMTWTADFTAGALRLTGIPVYREGQQLVIPTGVWSVVEACSGLRYLIASLMVGSLFAHLIYRSFKRRLMFVLLSIAVPIVANWLRAYMIVLLGHVSGNRLAAGVDHLIYGWIFFGVVIACLFSLGSRWREDTMPAKQTYVADTREVESPSLGRLWVATAAVLAITAVWRFGYFAIERNDDSSPPSLVAPGVDAPWQRSDRKLSSWRPHFVNPSTVVETAYRDGERSVGVFVSYYRNQDRKSKLVSSENKLVTSDDQSWLRIAEGTRTVNIAGRAVEVRTTDLRGPGDQKLLVWHWYWVNGQLTANAYLASAYIAASRIQGQGDDSAGVVIYTAKGPSDTGEGALQAFMQAAAPGIEATLRQTRNAR
jgi:exosortase A